MAMSMAMSAEDASEKGEADTADSLLGHCTNLELQQGFTLVELMIVVLVTAILATVAAPGFTSAILNSALVGESGALLRSLNRARMEAINQRHSVVVCASRSGTACDGPWNAGHIVFIDENNNATLDASEEIVQQHTVDQPRISIAFNNVTDSSEDRVQFDQRGLATTHQGSIVLCDERGDSHARAVNVARSGHVEAARDTDASADGIVNDYSSANVSCGE